MRVHSKGVKNRSADVPGQGMVAVRPASVETVNWARPLAQRHRTRIREEEWESWALRRAASPNFPHVPIAADSAAGPSFHTPFQP